MTAEHEATKLMGGTVASTDSPVDPNYTEVIHRDPSYYTKFILALAAAAGATFVQLSGHGNTLFLVLSIIIAVLQAFLTYQFSAGDRVLTSLKFWANIVAVVAQGILALVGAGGDLGDITQTQWVTIGLSVISALGVAVLPNGPEFQQKVVNNNTVVIAKDRG